MLNDEQLLKEYHEFLLANKRKKTADIYLFLLQHFIEYLHNVGKTLHTAVSQDIQRYIATKKWSNVSKIMFITIIKTFYEKQYLLQIPVGVTTDEIRWRLERENQVRAILNYPLPHKETVQKNKALSLEEVRKLLEYLRKHNILDYALFWILLYTGMRKGELLQLHPIKNILWNENKIHLFATQTKNHMERDIFFDDYTKKVLIYILKTVGSKDNLTNFSETHLNKMFYKYNRIVMKHLFPHICRHIFITNMSISISGNYKGNEDILIKTLAGHNIKNSDMTAHYTNITSDILKEIMIKYHYMLQFEK